MPFSTSYAVLPDLLQVLMREWSLPDLRLLAEIMRIDNDPLRLCQDIIHISQKRHPLPFAHHAPTTCERCAPARPPLPVQRIAEEDVYFLPVRTRGGPEPIPYTGSLLIGRVAAHQHLSAHVLFLGEEEPEEQWVKFYDDALPAVFEEQPQWQEPWQAAWQAFKEHTLHAGEISEGRFPKSEAVPAPHDPPADPLP